MWTAVGETDLQDGFVRGLMMENDLPRVNEDPQKSRSPKGGKQIAPQWGGLSGKVRPGTGAVNPVTKAPLGRDVCFRPLGDILQIALLTWSKVTFLRG
jgi:hypothetical protein